MIKYIFILVLFSCFAIAEGQDISYSNEMDINAKKVIFYENVNNQAYFTFRVKSKASILIWDKSINTINTYLIDNEYKNKKLRIISIFRIDAKWLVFGAFWNEKQKKDYLFAYWVNNDGIRIGGLTKVAQLNVITYPTKGLYAVKFTPDKQNFVIVYSHTSMWNKFILPLRLKVFSKDLKLVYSRRAHIRFIDEYITATQVIIDNKLEVFINITVDKETVKKSSLLFIPKEFYILSTSHLDSNLKTHRLLIPNKVINKSIISLHNNKLHFGGYYSNKDIVSIRGVFFGIYERGVFKDIRIGEFSDSLIKQYTMANILKDKYPNEILCFDARNIEFDKTGNRYLIGELIIKYSFGKNKPHGFLYEIDETSKYKYGDILITKMTESNKLAETIIKKQHVGRYDEKISYSYSIKNNNLSFVFNKSNTKQAVFFNDSKGNTQLYKFTDTEYNHTSIDGVSCCNPAIYKPFRFEKSMYFLHIDSHKKSRLMEIGIN